MQNITIYFNTIIAFLISFYSLNVNKIGGGTIAFAPFAGKKVLIVNTAINTTDTVQYRKLELLYQKYKDSLVIIAIPSNSFAHNPQSDSATKAFILTKYNAHYIIASKTNIKGPQMHPLYRWLADVTKNGRTSSVVNNDFCKYLIDKNGNLIGIFSKQEDPMGANIKSAVEL